MLNIILYLMLQQSYNYYWIFQQLYYRIY